jgi:hypothetical protein
VKYRFQVVTEPTKFEDKDFFNSENFWNYQKQIGIKSYYIEIIHTDKAIGYIIVTKRNFFTMSIYGSPIRGIGADFQGFVFHESYLFKVDYDNLLFDFAIFIKKFKYNPIRILERKLEISFLNNYQWCVNKSIRYVLNLEKSLEEIKKGFSYKSATYEINKAQKRGLYVTKEANIDKFLDIHFNHLEDVFSRKKLPVPHSKDRLSKLFKSLNKNQYLLSIAYNKEGLPIASNTYLIGEEMSYFYTAASLKDYLIDSPNEILMYESIKELKLEGSKLLEFGRGMDYKKKYGPDEVEFLELYSREGFWKVELINNLENRYKKLRKSGLFKRFLNKYISRIMHYRT